MRFCLLAAAMLILSGCRSASRQHNTPEVRIAIGGRAALDFIPVYLASSLGFFREADLRVSLADLPSTPQAVQALLGGSSDVAAGGYDAVFEMAAQKQQLTAIMNIERWPPYVLVTQPNAARSVGAVQNLKGTLVGVSSPGSSTHRFLDYVLVKNGLAPSDVTPIAVGVNFSMAAAVQHGRVGTAVAGPLGMALLSKSSTVTALADCRTAEGAIQTFGTLDLPAAVLMVRPQLVHDNPEMLGALVKAVRRALAWVHEHSAQDVWQAMPHEYRGATRDLYLTAVQNIQPVFSNDGLMPLDGPRHVKDYLAVSNQEIRNTPVNLGETYTNEFVQAR